MVINSHHEDSIWNGDQPQINREQDAETQGKSQYCMYKNVGVSAMQPKPALWNYRSFSKMFFPKHFGQFSKVIFIDVFLDSM